MEDRVSKHEKICISILYRLNVPKTCLYILLVCSVKTSRVSINFSLQFMITNICTLSICNVKSPQGVINCSICASIMSYKLSENDIGTFLDFNCRISRGITHLVFNRPRELFLALVKRCFKLAASCD